VCGCSRRKKGGKDIKDERLRVRREGSDNYLTKVKK